MKKLSSRMLLMLAALASFVVAAVAFAAAGFIDGSVFVADTNG